MALNVHTNQQYVKYSETNTWRNRTWERIPRITRNAPGRTLAAITPFPFLCAFPQDNPLKIPLLEASSHTYIYQSQNKKPKYVPKKEGKSSFPFFFFFSSFFQSFLFYFMYLCHPPKTQSAEGNLLSFILFPFLYENQNVSLILCRISSFHMYATTLILFSLQKYFSYLLRVHVP